MCSCSADGIWPASDIFVNKCIGDDTKAAARQSPNCIKKTKQKIWQNDFQYGGWNSYTLQCGTIMTLILPGDCTLQYGMWHGSGIVTVNSPSGSRPTLQRDTTRGSGMTCNWIRQVAAPCNVACGSAVCNTVIHESTWHIT